MAELSEQDRRRFKRMVVCFPSVVQADQETVLPVESHNFSAGGVAFTSPQAIDPGRVFLFKPTEEEEGYSAQVLDCTPGDQGFFVRAFFVQPIE